MSCRPAHWYLEFFFFFFLAYFCIICMHMFRAKIFDYYAEK